jgi:uncharacterized membrane protein YeaQ/YmgE (transglycosylase-associated protein family)
VDSIPARCDSPHDGCVQAALLSWLLIGGVVGLVADRIARDAFPGGALAALFGGGAGALVAAIGAAGRGSVRGP